MKVAITGSNGLIGSALVPHLQAAGHEVVRIVRHEAGPGDVVWNPREGTIDVRALDRVGAVIHLAGAGVADRRWSASYKETILSSRVAGTTTIAAAVTHMAEPPSVLISASAIGYYGAQADEVLTETSKPGDDFLADVCRQWEESTAAAHAAGVRVVHLRTGIVLSAAGGALAKQLPIFRLALGARLGNGKQVVSWITRRDHARATALLLEQHDLEGPFNLTAPDPVSNAEFTKHLGTALHRPAKLVVPEAALRVALGREMANETLLASQRAMPSKLWDAGFAFLDRTLPHGLATALGDR